MRFLDVVDDDVFLLWVHLEVGFETCVADNLLLELKDLLLLDGLWSEMVDHGLDSGLDFGDFSPHDRHALHLHVLTKVLVELLLEKLEHLDVVWSAWRG